MKLRLEIMNFKYSLDKKINLNNKVIFSIYIFNKIRILKINFSMKKINNLRIIKLLKKIEINKKANELIKEYKKYGEVEKLNSNENIKKLKFILKNLKININSFDLKLEIGTIDCIFTSFLIPIISSVLTLILNRYNNKLENEKFVIMPVYKNKNFINIDFTGIFEIKMISIINIFLNIRKMKINNCKKNKKFNKNFNKNNERRLNKKNFEYCN